MIKKMLKDHNIIKSLVIIILAIAMLSASFAWMYDEFIGSGADMVMGEISHNITLYDKNGNILNTSQDIYTLIKETNISNASRNSLFIEIENTGTLDLEYGLTFTLDGELETAGIMYYRLYEVTTDVDNTNASGYDSKISSYAHNHPLVGDIERDTNHPVSNMSLINNYIQIGDIYKSTNNHAIYRFDYGVYDTVNTSLYNNQKLSIHMNVYSSQIGVITNENKNGYVYEVQTEAQFRDVLREAVSGDTILLLNDITITGTVNIPRRININTNNHTLEITEDFIYEFVNTGDLTIDVDGNGHLVVGHDFVFNTPKANVTVSGSNKIYDIVVGGDLTVNTNLSDGDDGFYLENCRVVKSKSTLVPHDILVKSNTKVLIGTDVTVGNIIASEGSTNIEVINNGNITQINLSAMELIDTFTKYQIYVYNLGEIYGVLGSTGVVLPSTSTPYIEPGNGNTLIIKGITSGDFTVSGSDAYNNSNITNNTEDITVVPITDEDNSYIVYIKDSTVSVESLLRQYFNDQGFTDVDSKIGQIRKLVIYTLNAQYFENEDFDFLKSNAVPLLETLNLNNAKVIDDGIVNQIKDYAMYDKTSLRNLVLPKTVTKIGNYAFTNCPLGIIPSDESFSFLTIPQTVTNIGAMAFNAAEYVEILNIIPPTINASSFNIADGGVKVFVTDGAVESYQNNTPLNPKNIYILSKLSDNKYYFVYDKDNGVGVSYNVNNYLSASILSVPATIQINGTNSRVLEIGPNAYRLLNIVGSEGINLQLANTITSIRDNAFYGLNIRSASLSNVVSIGNYAFYETRLNEVLANSLNTIGDYAFYNTPVNRVIIGNVTSIGERAFARSENLYELNLGTVKYIGSQAFTNCPNLLKVYVNNTDSVFINNSEEIDITLGNYAFDNSWGSYSDGRLRIYVPAGEAMTGSSYLSLYKKLFSNLQNYVYVSGIETGTYSHMGINYQINEYTLRQVTLTNRNNIEVTGYEIVSYQGADLDNNYTIPNNFNINGRVMNVISIGEGAYQNVNIIENSRVSINNNNIISIGVDSFNGRDIYEVSGTGITTVKDRAFANSKIQTSSFPNLKLLGNDAYNNATNLVMINLGNVSNIGDGALKDCVNLQQIFFTNTSNEIIINGDAFLNMGSGTDNRIRIYVPETSVSYYKEIFPTYANYIYNTGIIIGSYLGNLNFNIGEFSVREVVLKNANNQNITGYEIIEYHGASIDGSYEIPTQVNANNRILNVISIGDGAYLNTSYTGSSTFDINNGNILNIGTEAFKNSTVLRHVTLNNCLKIGTSAFENSSITIGSFVGIDEIGSMAFNDASTLYKLELGGVTKIGYHAFSNIPKLYVIDFTVQSLDLQFNSDAFYNVGYETNDRMRFYVTNGENNNRERYVDIYRNQINENYSSYFFSYDLIIGDYILTDIPEEINIGEYTVRNVTVKDQSNNNINGYEFVEYHGDDTTQFYEFPQEVALSDSTLSATISSPTNTYGSEGNWTSEYQITITNNGTEGIDSWRVVLDTIDSGGVTRCNGFTSNVTINANSITLTNASYNGTIQPGRSITTRIQLTRATMNYTPIVKIVRTNSIAADAIPIVSIGKDAFHHSRSATGKGFTVNANNIYDIGDGAFETFAGLYEINAPKVLRIGKKAFQASTGLKKAEFPKLTDVGENAFMNATELASLNVGYISNIPTGLFQQTYKMTTLYLYSDSALADTSEMNMSIGENAFTNMGTTAGSRLRIYVPKGNAGPDLSFVDAYRNTLPEAYTPYIYEMGITVGSYDNNDTGINVGSYTVNEVVISGVRGWQIVDYHGANIDSSFEFPATLSSDSATYPVVAIGNRAFYHVMVNNGYEWYLNIPDSVLAIGDYAFYQRDIMGLTINDINSIGAYAFANIDDMLNVSINSINTIGPYAFYLNSNLNTVSLGTGVTSIGDFAFYNPWSSNSLVTFYINTQTPPTIYANTLPSQFWSLGTTSPTVYVPDAYVSTYRQAQYWRNYTISRIGSVYQNTYLYNIINNNEIEIIGYISTRVLSTITIPSQFIINGRYYNVTSIKKDAFDSAAGATTISIPQYVNNIENGFLGNNASISRIRVDATNQYFSANNNVLFNKQGDVLIRYPRGNTSTNYNLPNNTKVIAYSAFLNCTNLQSINFNTNLVSISYGAFDGATGLQTLTFNSSTPPYLTGFGTFPMNANLSLRFPNAYAQQYRSNVFYQLYRNYFTNY